MYSTNEPTMGRTAIDISEFAAHGLYGLTYFTPTKDSIVPAYGFILPDGSIVQISHSANALKLYEMLDARDIRSFRLRTGIITVNTVLSRVLYSMDRQPSNKQLDSIRLMSESSGNKIYTNFGGLDGYKNYNEFIRDLVHMYPPVKQR